MTNQGVVAMPRRVAALLVAGHVDLLWSQWANDPEMPGCCTECCGPCAALKELLDTDLLDDLYGAYIEGHGESETWDAERRQVGREWLLAAWAWACPNHE